MNSAARLVGQDALLAKGWWGAHRWLALRRVSQFALLALFLLGPWFGWWIVKGNLNYSLTLNTLPLTDPLVLAQSLAAGHLPQRSALTGVAIVLIFYLLVGGRSYCAWVCPVNIVTDAASVLRRRLGIRGGGELPRSTRYYVLAMVLLLSAASGRIVWEAVNPVSMLHRGLLFGMGAGAAWIVAIFLADLFVVKRGWCTHLCPVGACYSLLGRFSVLRVSANRRQDCNDCLDCYAVCPEQQVLRQPLKGQAKGVGPLILSPNCSNCGRCIDVCAKDVFTFSTRFDRSQTGVARAPARR